MRYWLGRAWLFLFGWRVEGVLPEHPKFVLIAAPHTSNWDLPFMLATAYVFRVRLSWMGKHTIFRPPFGWFMRWLGGIPIDRRSPQGIVGQMVDAMGLAERLVLAVPPQGTRSRTRYWKSGFYHIARAAGVPIGLSFLDFRRKVSGLGPFLLPSGDVRADMDRIREFYRDIRGKHPAKETVPRLGEEDDRLEDVG